GLQRVIRGEACAFYARAAVAAGAFGSAFDHYKDALEADPRCVDYRIEMAVKVHMPMGNFKLAQQEARRAVAMEPENPATWRALGEAEYALCNALACRDAYERQLSLIPDDPAAMMDVCVIALDQADYGRVERLTLRISEVGWHAEAVHA